MNVCAEPGCPLRTARRLCPNHDRASSRNHAGRSASSRGYGAAYRRERGTLIGQPCALRLEGCTDIATTAQHTDSGDLVPACGHCNYADGARRATRARLARC